MSAVAGQRLLIAECKPGTGEAVADGFIVWGTVQEVSARDWISVTPDVPAAGKYNWVATRFSKDTGYNTYGPERSWRLVTQPLPGEAWETGQDCLVVEHDDRTRQPRDGGQVVQAVVTGTSDLYVRALGLDGNLAGNTAAFWASTGWTAWDGSFRWRLFPLPVGAP